MSVSGQSHLCHMRFIAVLVNCLSFLLSRLIPLISLIGLMKCWGNSEQQLACPKTWQVGLHPAVNETLNIDFGDLPAIWWRNLVFLVVSSVRLVVSEASAVAASSVLGYVNWPLPNCNGWKIRPMMALGCLKFYNFFMRIWGPSVYQPRTTAGLQ